MKGFIFPILLSLLAGCVQNAKTIEKGDESSKVDSTEDKETSVETIEIDSTIVFGDHFEVLELGTCHGEEFSEELAKLTWQGLFYDTLLESYSLQPVSLKTERVYDGILDNEGEKSGWELSTTDDIQPLLLFSGLTVKNKVEIDAIQLSNVILKSGETVDFKFLQVDYRLKGFTRDSFIEESQFTQMKDYRLELSNLSQFQQQTLTSSDFLHENIPNIVFTGDLDQDGKLDLIVDCSTHYNSWGFSVFLSSKAKPSQLVGLVTESYRSGC